MLAIERLREIERKIRRDGSARVAELARELSVTEETIRRDLEKLELEKKVVRSHGGAVAGNGGVAGAPEIPYPERELRQAAEKAAIARTAVQRVEEGDTLFIDASSTALELARLLPDMPLTVLTNAVKVAVELARAPRIRVICTGGALAAQSLSFYGPAAEKAMHEFHVGKLFLSCKGIDLKRGLSDANELLAEFKRLAIERSSWRCLLADHTKFGVNGFAVFAQLSEFNEIITNAAASAEVLAGLKQSGVGRVSAV
jgi:DeoR/GlpR family transcriptional regulator of sugar metabolism